MSATEPDHVTDAWQPCAEVPASRNSYQEAVAAVAELLGPPPTSDLARQRAVAYDRIRVAQETAATCARCGEAIPSDAPVWLAPHRLLWDGGFLQSPSWQSYPAATCAPCAPSLCHPSWWYSPLACGGCGRPVYYKRPNRPTSFDGLLGHSRRQRGYCSAACRAVARTRRRAAAGAAVRRKACAVCGTVFEAPRRDAVTCSPACRQRAYRQRRAPAERQPYLTAAEAGEQQRGRLTR